MKGKTKSQRKAIFKAAARSWKKGSKSKSKPKSKLVARRPASKSTGGRSTMAKGGLSTQKLFKYMRYGALAIPAAETVMTPGHSIQWKVQELSRKYFGYHPGVKQFKWEWLAEGWTPFAAANLVTIGIPKAVSILRRL